jgi:hypothetical protein
MTCARSGSRVRETCGAKPAHHPESPGTGDATTDGTGILFGTAVGNRGYS